MRPIALNRIEAKLAFLGQEFTIYRRMRPQGPMQPECWINCRVRYCDGHLGKGWYAWDAGYEEEGSYRLRCHYGEPGDVLWVKEACIISPPHFCDRDSDLYNVTDREGRGRICQYISTSPDTSTPIEDYGLKITPSIHMPRWASRSQVKIVEARPVHRGDGLNINTDWIWEIRLVGSDLQDQARSTVGLSNRIS